MRMNKEVVMVRLSDIIPNRFQPRLTFDEEALNELASSIKEHGIIQPLILRDLGSKYEIIAGERRYKASTLAGLTEVPAIVGSMDDQTSAELALIENIQRKDLSAIEEAKSYKKILDMGNFTQEELAKRMGKGQSTIANKMRLLALTNEVQVALMNNLISERHARCLLQIKDESKQKEVLNKIITERMNVRDTDEYIKNMLGIANIPPKEVPTPTITQFEVSKAPEVIAPEVPEVPTITQFETPKAPEVIVPEVSVPPVQTPEVPEVSVPKTQDENPNVYAQNKNDFIDINKLTEEKTPVKTALEGLNVIENKSDIFDENTIEVEDKREETMNTTKALETPTQKTDNMSKVKLATAIKVAKDALEDIKSAGYTAQIEEVDGLTEYQIIIKVQK